MIEAVAAAEVSEGAELSSGAEIDPDARIEPTDMTDGIGEMTSPEEVDPDARIRELPEAKGPQKTIEPNDFSQSENVVDKPAQNAEIDPDARIEANEAESKPQNDVTEDRKTGGTYGELKKEWGGELENPPPHEVHHMPAKDVNGLKENDGPAIVMEKADHRQTASCGSSREAREYRQKQKELVDAGKFEEAMQMDIDDIHDKFGDKYDDAIAQMKETAKEKGLI